MFILYYIILPILIQNLRSICYLTQCWWFRQNIRDLIALIETWVDSKLIVRTISSTNKNKKLIYLILNILVLMKSK